MPNFKVHVRTDDPAEMAKALDGAGLKGGRDLATEAMGDEDFSGRMTIVLEAADAAEAETRVRKAVGDGPEVGPVEQSGSDA